MASARGEQQATAHAQHRPCATDPEGQEMNEFVKINIRSNNQIVSHITKSVVAFRYVCVLLKANIEHAFNHY